MSDMSFVWDSQKVSWYDKALEFSDFSDVVMDLISPCICSSDSVIDVGCGPGTLVASLAAVAGSVTALEPSSAMFSRLQAKCSAIGNVTCVNSSFDSDIPKHDILISANVFSLWSDNIPALQKAVSITGKFVFLILPAGSNRDKFYFNQLYPILFGREYQARDDYLKVYTQIHDYLEVLPDISVFDYRFDQPFSSIDEAVMFWRSYLNIDSGEYDSRLRVFLEKKLKRVDDLLVAEFPKKAAMIWWST